MEKEKAKIKITELCKKFKIQIPDFDNYDDVVRASNEINNKHYDSNWVEVLRKFHNVPEQNRFNYK